MLSLHGSDLKEWYTFRVRKTRLVAVDAIHLLIPRLSLAMANSRNATVQTTWDTRDGVSLIGVPCVDLMVRTHLT